MRAIEDYLDIINIAESWIIDGVKQAEVTIAGYKKFLRDRSEVKAGKVGGVVLYIKKAIPPCECVVLRNSKTESLWSKVISDKVKGNGLNVGVCYESPNADCNEVEGLFRII